MIKRYSKLFITLLKFKLSARLVYSYDFWSAFFADSMLFFVQLLTFSAIFSHVEQVNGWTINEVIVFIGTFTLIDGLTMATYFFGVITLPEKIRTGRLDIYITKPVNTLFYSTHDSMSPGSFMVCIAGIIMVLYGASKMGIEFSFGLLFGYIFLALMMFILMFSLSVILRSVAFWFVRIDSLMEIENQLIEFAFRVPGVVYKGFMKIILWVVLPYGLIATIQTQLLAGMMDPKTWLFVITITVTFFTIAVLLFKKGLSVYSSASS